MAMLARSILGVDITPYEIRVVEVQGTGANVQVLRAGSAPLPPGALEGDRIAEPVPVAEILHELIGRLEVGTRQAVLGVGAHSVITRVLEIPRVPDHEVRTVVEGELAYYKILGEGTGAFDYMRLPDPEPGSDTPPQVLLMAMEDRIAGGYREVAERAGLTLVALEPVLLAVYRVAFPQLLAQRTRVCLAVSYARSEITVVEEGRIRLYRQVDVGSDHLIDGRPRPGYGAGQTPGLGDRFLLSGEEEQESPDLTSEFDGPINPFAANDLASELQRSIEYFRRRFPLAETARSVVLATHDPDVEPLAGWLSRTLALTVVVAEPPRIPAQVGAAEAPDHGAAMRPSAVAGAHPELAYVGAVGLAAHALPGQNSLVPRFDLAQKERQVAEAEISRLKLTTALAASIFFLLAGMVAALIVGMKANALEHEVFHRREDLHQKQQIVQAQFDAMQAQTEQFRTLRLEGFPFPKIMDAVTATVDPHAGLTDVTLDRNGALNVTGDAANEKAIINTLEGLQRCPYFENTSLNSLERTNVAEKTPPVLKYHITSQLAGVRRPATDTQNR